MISDVLWQAAAPHAPAPVEAEVGFKCIQCNAVDIYRSCMLAKEVIFPPLWQAGGPSPPPVEAEN